MRWASCPGGLAPAVPELLFACNSHAEKYRRHRWMMTSTSYRQCRTTSAPAHHLSRSTDPIVSPEILSFLLPLPLQVLPESSNQADVFEVVGAPALDALLAGCNTAVLCYGHSGAGKSYTMVGPLQHSGRIEPTDTQRGLAPRMLERLFSRCAASPCP